MKQERDTSAIRLTEFDEPEDLDLHSPPKVRGTRRLQMVTFVVALLWTLVGVLCSHQLIQDLLHKALVESQQQLNNEVQFRVRVLQQKLYQAEQLSLALSLNQSYVELARAASNSGVDLNSLMPQERVDFILQLPGVQEVNQSFKQLVSRVDAYQVFLQDAHGYCIASGRSGEEDDCIGSAYNTREYFNEAEKDGHGRQFAVGRLHTVPSFFFSSAINDGDEFLGVIILRLLTGQVADFVQPDKTLTLVTGNDGVIIASSDPALVFHHLGEPWAPLPTLESYRKIYKRADIQSLEITPLPETRKGLSLWLWKERCHLVAHDEVVEGDFQIFLFKDVEHIIADAQNHWILSIAILLAGLLAILLIERSINYSLQRKAHLKALTEANRNLAAVTRELYELTITDSLTGVSSRRYFNQKLEKEAERQQRNFQMNTDETSVNEASENRRLSLLSIDIDHFKQVNDNYGHPAGDEAIRVLADICVQSVRPQDTVGRMGGEEFAILLCEVTAEQSRDIAERILNKCRNTDIRFQEHCFRQSCSIGIASLKPGQSAGQLLSEADKALYKAKNEGRDRYEYLV